MGTPASPTDVAFMIGLFSGGGFALFFTGNTVKKVMVGFLFLIISVVLAIWG